MTGFLILNSSGGNGSSGSGRGARSEGQWLDPTWLALKRKIHDSLVEDRQLKTVDFISATDEELRERTEKSVRSIVSSIAVSDEIDRSRLIKEVLDDALGLGPIQDLIKEPEVNEIMVNGADMIFVERKGGAVELTGRRFYDDAHLIETIRRIVSPLGKRINESSPMVDARLPDGSRVNAIIPPLAVSGPALTIRKFPEERLAASDLVGLGTLTEKALRFLNLCIAKKANICISGGTGSGKTTLLNILASMIPKKERIITIEDVCELQLKHQNKVRLESRSANIEGEGEIPIRKLVINALRMRPDRMIVGECRGGEAFDMLQAMNTGHEGSLTTVHANSPADALARMENMVLMSNMNLPSAAIREQISNSIHFIIQMVRFSDGSRKITHISEVGPLEDGRIVVKDIFALRSRNATGERRHHVLVPTGNYPAFFGGGAESRRKSATIQKAPTTRQTSANT